MVCIVAAVAAITGYTYASQTQPAGKAQSFEVASIKPNVSGDGRFGVAIQPGGRLTVTGANVKMLMRQAYRIQDFQIIGAPSWFDSDRFDIVAKAEGKADADQVREMLQSLLAERFELKFHRDTRELPVYALVVGKSGPKMELSDSQGRANNSMMKFGRSQIEAQGMSMPQLAQTLSLSLGRTVIDKTGINGNYNFKLEWMPEAGQTTGPAGADKLSNDPPLDPSLPSIFTAVQEQLGLRLESQKGPVEVFVIDSASKPKENQ